MPKEWQQSQTLQNNKHKTIFICISAIPVYLVIAMDMPKWVIKMIDKIRRGFLWKRRKEVNGGSFLVSWEKVARPIDLGRPGSPNLQMWDGPCKCVVSGYIKLYEGQSWASDNPIHPQARAMFAISVTTQDGSVNNTLYWSDWWLHGCSLVELASAVAVCASKKFLNNRTVAQGLENRAWVRDMQGGLPMEGCCSICKFGMP